MKSFGFIGRRHFLTLAGMGSIGSLLCYPQPVEAVELASGTSQKHPEFVSPDAALKRLLDGNKRFMQFHPQYPHQSQARLQEVAYSQYPFATLLSCADSRVPAEIIFDQGIGDLFDVRLAGNVVIPEALGSLEYAAAVLGTRLIMVLGHERCGAVTAAIKGELLPGQIGTFVKAIKPVLTQIKGSVDSIEDAVVANVLYQVDKLRHSELLHQLVESGKLKIVGGRYDLDTGKVSIVTA